MTGHHLVQTQSKSALAQKQKRSGFHLTYFNHLLHIFILLLSVTQEILLVNTGQSQI